MVLGQRVRHYTINEGQERLQHHIHLLVRVCPGVSALVILE
jgi:hypothetical protein